MDKLGEAIERRDVKKKDLSNSLVVSMACYFASLRLNQEPSLLLWRLLSGDVRLTGPQDNRKWPGKRGKQTAEE